MKIIKVSHNKSDLLCEKNKLIHSLDEKCLDKELANEEFYSLAKSHYDLEKKGVFLVDSSGSVISVDILARSFGPFGKIKTTTEIEDPLEKYKIEYKSIFKKSVKKSISNIISRLSVEFLTLDELLKIYPNTKKASIGTYTNHPLDSKSLSKLENFHKNLSIEKDDELILLLQKMGAKRVKISEENSLSQNNSSNFSAGIKNFGFDANVDFSNDSLNQKELTVEFEGNSEIKIKRNILENSIWHKKNSQLNALYIGRKNKKNKLLSYTLANEYDEKFEFDFKMAAKFILAEVDLENDYNKLSKRKRLFRVEF